MRQGKRTKLNTDEASTGSPVLGDPTASQASLSRLYTITTSGIKPFSALVFRMASPMVARGMQTAQEAVNAGRLAATVHKPALTSILDSNTAG